MCLASQDSAEFFQPVKEGQGFKGEEYTSRGGNMMANYSHNTQERH